ncbi:coiled-coil domain-containing protein 172 [Sceloporus undulatus]|uniref:coiled-coil domain-containing protein 172 n=1 Tax=Sceloporus undulatus TaxID=8520 RepID=UPI001C4C07F0|nr:coiled-coil domain-containing protein 172 [Sceloporus undulatus]
MSGWGGESDIIQECVDRGGSMLDCSIYLFYLLISRIDIPPFSHNGIQYFKVQETQGKMSLDSLFQQILLTEQKAEEKRRHLHQVKQEIALGHEKAKQLRQQLDEAKSKLEDEVQLLSEKFFHLEILKKREESLEKQKAELLCQKSILLETFMEIKRKNATEDDKFLKELTDFNNEYALTSNREILIKKRIQAEICELEEKENVLRNEIESMEHKNAQLKMFQLQKNELKEDLFTLQKKLKGFENEIREAKCTTKYLEMEKNQISEKPQTDPECVRLKKELETYKENEMENVCAALQMEIEFLQMKLLPKKSSHK